MTALIDRPGIVVIDKPRGPSSHQVAAWVGEILGVPVGHAGTLDPMVSGVLVVMLGRAVRLARLLLRHEKEYVCLLRLHGDVTEASVREVAAEFVGRIYQRPPRRSAVKRQLRIRRIHALDVLEVDGRLVLIRVACEAGTYIRSLCHHLGLALGCGGHMVELRRTRSGAFGEDEAVTLSALKDAAVRAAEGDRAGLEAMVLPVEVAVPDLKVITIGDRAVDAVSRGAALAGVGATELAAVSRRRDRCTRDAAGRARRPRPHARSARGDRARENRARGSARNGLHGAGDLSTGMGTKRALICRKFITPFQICFFN